MRRAFWGLPTILLLCGCHSLVRNAEVIDYRPGTTPATTVTKQDGEFRLEAPDANRSWIQTDVQQGSAVGFRNEPDGSVVAFAGTQTWTIEEKDGRHVWRFTPKPVTAWDRFLVRTRDKTEDAFITTLLVVTAPIWIAQCSITGVWP